MPFRNVSVRCYGSAMKRTVVANDKMQRGYVYYRTEPVGRNFAPGFEPQLTPKQMLKLGVFGGKYMTDCRGEFPASWFAARQTVRRPSRSASELLRRQRVTVARCLATERLDSSAGSARMVSMVLPLLHGAEDAGRRKADSTVARDRAARRGDSEELREGRRGLPAPTATGRPALGL